MDLKVNVLADIKAYILCKVNSGTEREVCNALTEYSYVSEVNIVYGDYDVIAVIRVENLQQLDFMIDKIRMMSGITFSTTMIVGKEYKDNGKLFNTRKLDYNNISK
jgi:DNA-binding Lrp family transcriptional regulator